MNTYLTPEEIETSMYAHVIDEIVNDDRQIVVSAIEAAIDEAKSYLMQRYDVEKIFSADGSDRNALILENVKVITVWNIIKLSNAETIYDMWKERYDRVIDWFKQVAKGNATANLPLITDADGEVKLKIKFGSNDKFTHSF